jgi:hypothetical protein
MLLTSHEERADPGNLQGTWVIEKGQLAGAEGAITLVLKGETDEVKKALEEQHSSRAFFNFRVPNFCFNLGTLNWELFIVFRKAYPGRNPERQIPCCAAAAALHACILEFGNRSS